MSRQSSVIENTRELLLSSDLNRLQRLSNREIQNREMDYNREDHWIVPGTGASSVGVTPSRKNILQVAPTWVPVPATFDVTIGAGEGLAVQAAVDPDDSDYVLFRWAAEVLTFSTPDPVNPRIDVVYALAGQESVDPQVRTIITDPNTGVTAPATVFKTQNPLATLAIAVGTPGANPHTGIGIPPANALPLFEVYIPAAAASSTPFGPIRATERSPIEYIGTTHGLLDGGTYKTTPNSDEGLTSTLSFDTNNDNLIRAVINGKLYVGRGGATGALNTSFVQVDSAADPFAAAPATNDRPYYLYLVPGLSVLAGVQVPFAPFTVIESLTTPRNDGRPSAPIIGPRGAVQGEALYIGCGWTVQGTTFRKPVVADGDDWVWAAGSSSGNFVYSRTRFAMFQETGSALGCARATPAGGGSTAFTLLTEPSVPNLAGHRRAKVFLNILGMADDEEIRFFAGTLTGMMLRIYNGVGAATAFLSYSDVIDIPFMDAGGSFTIQRPNAAGGGLGALACGAVAYKMNVNRLSVR